MLLLSVKNVKLECLFGKMYNVYEDEGFTVDATYKIAV